MVEIYCGVVCLVFLFYYEFLGFFLMEVMLFGCLVVCFDIFVLCEWCVDVVEYCVLIDLDFIVNVVLRVFKS